MTGTRPYVILTAAVFLLLAAFVSCTEQLPAADQETGTVSLTFRTKAGPDWEGAFDQGERISHIRIVIAESSSGRILYNYDRTLAEEETSVTVTFAEIPVGTYDFYAVANEASTGADFSILQDISSLTSFVCTADPDDFSSGVPASGMADNVSVSQGQTMRLAMTLDHIVAKIRLAINNVTSSPQSLSGFSISGIAGASSPLFPGAGQGNAAGSALNIPDSELASIPSYGSREIVRYVYPTASPEGGYVMSAIWNGSAVSGIINVDGSALAGLGRNGLLEAGINLLRGLEMTWTVSQWDSVDSEIEFTDSFIFSLSGQNVKTADYDGDGTSDCVVTALGSDAQQGERFVQFRFHMTSPSGQRWTAHLSDPVHFEFVGGYYGTGTEDASAGTVTLTVAPRYSYDSGQEWSTELYFTVEGLDGRQLVNADSRYPGADDSILIRQVSTVEYDSMN